MSENERRLTNVQITEEMYGGEYVRPNSCPYCTMCGAKGPCYVCDDTKLIYHAIEAEDLWNMVARRKAE